MNYSRLKKARLYRGIGTIEELAKKIGISKQALSQYETNKSSIPFKQLIAISTELNFPVDYFLQSDDDYFKIEAKSIYFRSLLKTTAKYKIQQAMKVDNIARMYITFLKYIDFPELNLPTIENKDNLSPENAAKILREYWKLGNKPITNLVSTLESNGLIVTRFSTETNDIDAFSRLFVHENKDIFVVALSTNKNSVARIHFDIAHELGHILLHYWEDDNDLLSKELFKQKEKEAHEFAANFLLPRKEFSNDLSRYSVSLKSLVLLKEKWHVSIAAMIYRAYELSFIDKTKYSYLMRQLSSKGWRKSEPLDDKLTTAQPSLLSGAVDLLLDNNIFSKSELLQEIKDDGLPMMSEDIEILLDLPKGKLKEEIIEKNYISLKKDI